MRASALIAALAAVTLTTIAVTAGVAGAEGPARPGLEGTIWVGNRGSTGPALAGFDAATGDLRVKVALDAPASDLAVGKGTIYVGEEALNRIAGVQDGQVAGRISTSARPHHFASGSGENLVAYAAFGTPKVGVIDARSGELLGEWAASANPSARVHATALARNGHTAYTANEGANEVGVVAIGSGLVRTIPVTRAHELVVTADERYLYVAARSDNRIRVVDLRSDTVVSELTLPLPDTLELSANGKQLTVGLRTNPARVAVLDVDGAALAVRTLIDLPGTLAGHQWTSGNGRWTFAAFEGASPGVAVIDHATDDVVQVLSFPGGGQPHGIAYAGPSAG